MNEVSIRLNNWQKAWRTLLVFGGAGPYIGAILLTLEETFQLEESLRFMELRLDHAYERLIEELSYLVSPETIFGVYLLTFIPASVTGLLTIFSAILFRKKIALYAMSAAGGFTTSFILTLILFRQNELFESTSPASTIVILGTLASLICAALSARWWKTHKV